MTFCEPLRVRLVPMALDWFADLDHAATEAALRSG
jgi:hypothetical protein